MKRRCPNRKRTFSITPTSWQVPLKQLEDTAREHPALVLLAAFTTGVVVGNLFSRR